MVVWSGSGDVFVVVRADSDGRRPLPGHLSPPARLRLVASTAGADAGRRSVGVGRRLVGAAARHLGSPGGGRRDGPARVLVGVRARLDREVVHDVVGGRHLRRSAGRDRRRLQPHLRRRLGQLTHARRCASVKLTDCVHQGRSQVQKCGVDTHGESAEREPITGSMGWSFQRDSEAEPLVRGSKPPEAENLSAFGV